MKNNKFVFPMVFYYLSKLLNFFINIFYDKFGTFLDWQIFIEIVDCYFLRFFFWKDNYFKKIWQHLLLKCCYISKNNNFVATVCLPHNFGTKSGRMNRINAMDKSNSLSYEYIRKNSNEFEDILAPPRNFLDGRQPAGRGTKVYRLLLSIYVVSHNDYWGSRNILNCFFFIESHTKR